MKCPKCHKEMELKDRLDERDGGMCGTYDTPSSIGCRTKVYEVSYYSCTCGYEGEEFSERYLYTEILWGTSSTYTERIIEE